MISPEEEWDTLIPRTLHYCFGLSPDFGGKPWSLVHYVCLKSAVERIKPTEVFFYCEYEPSGPWWELTRPMVTLKKIEAPREIFGNPILHPAHRADVVRLETLIAFGGIYLDADVFVHASFDPLLGHSVVMGEQYTYGNFDGLCNAVILGEKDAPFLKRWYAEYRSFRSKGRDEFWGEHPVLVPGRLARQFPAEIKVLPHTAFFWPTYSRADQAKMFRSREPIDLQGAYATHLWEQAAWERYLDQLTPRRVRAVDCNFHYWARPMVAGLPDDYAAPTVAERAARAARLARWLGRRAVGRFSRECQALLRAG